MRDLVDSEAIEELESASDRAVGVIAGAIIDARIRRLLLAALHPDNTQYTSKISGSTFHPDGPLGSYGSKVAVAYLMGYFTPQAHRELVTFGNIRNQFAHYAAHRSFDSEKIGALCANLKIVESRVKPPMGPPRLTGLFVDVNKKNFWFGTIGGQTVLNTSKARFIWTAKVFYAALTEFEENRIDKPLL